MCAVVNNTGSEMSTWPEIPLSASSAALMPNGGITGGTPNAKWHACQAYQRKESGATRPARDYSAGIQRCPEAERGDGRRHAEHKRVERACLPAGVREEGVRGHARQPRVG